MRLQNLEPELKAAETEVVEREEATLAEEEDEE